MNKTLTGRTTREQAITATREALIAAGHTPWASLNDDAYVPTFTVFHSRRVLVTLNYATPTEKRAEIFAAYAADLNAAGLPAEIGDNCVRVLVRVSR